jgi:hypothetical protein
VLWEISAWRKEVAEQKRTKERGNISQRNVVTLFCYRELFIDQKNTSAVIHYIVSVK